MLRRNRTKDQLVALFVLGALLLLPPLIVIFNQPLHFFGIPVLYLYLFLAWIMFDRHDCSGRAPHRCLAKAATSRCPARGRPKDRAMLNGPVIVLVSLLYLSLLFAIAYYGDKRADQSRSIIATPHVYALSIAVYCTSWTFFGSVGRAASTGVGFLPIYLGPTLTFVVGWLVIRKIIRISKVNRITSIADFIASRYGKSFALGSVVSIIAVVGILPYISLQLKAISTSFSILFQYPDVVMPKGPAGTSILQDTELYVTLAMAAFAILFGTRHIDASERHEGMVAAIAFSRSSSLWHSWQLACSLPLVSIAVSGTYLAEQRPSALRLYGYSRLTASLDIRAGSRSRSSLWRQSWCCPVSFRC